MSNALDKMIAARVAMSIDHPFFGYIAMNLNLVEDPGCGTAWVNGRDLGFDPAWVMEQQHDQLVATLTHEAEHVALLHPWRREGRDQTEWNKSCDKVVNHDLREAGFRLPDGVLYATGEEIGKSAEWVYGNAMNQQGEQEPEPEPQPSDEENEEEQESQGNDSEDEDGEQEGDGESEDGEAEGDGEGDSEGEGEGEGDSEGEGEGEGEGTGDGAGSGTGSKPSTDPLGDLRDAPTEADGEGNPPPSEDEWRERVAQAVLHAESMGNMPGALKRLVQKALKPKVDVKSLLLRFLTERCMSDYSWSMPSTRYISQGLYLPALQSKDLGEVAILCDTSGSIGEQELAKAQGIVQDVLEECNPAGITLYFVDAAVQHVERLEKGDPLKWEPAGGGGTDFRSFFEQIERAEIDPVCVIGISDLAATFPENVPAVPVLWLTDNEYYKAPFGETVLVEV